MALVLMRPKSGHGPRGRQQDCACIAAILAGYQFREASWGRIVCCVGPVSSLGGASQFVTSRLRFSSLEVLESRLMKLLQGHRNEARLGQLASLEHFPSWLVACGTCSSLKKSPQPGHTARTGK